MSLIDQLCLDIDGGDDEALLFLADVLEEEGDPRVEGLRTVILMGYRPTQLVGGGASTVTASNFLGISVLEGGMFPLLTSGKSGTMYTSVSNESLDGSKSVTVGSTGPPDQQHT